MKYYRLATAQGPAWARQEGDGLRLLAGAPFAGARDLEQRLSFAEARLLAPATPSKIVAVGLNYKDHAAERGKPLPQEPLLFMKPASAVIGPGDVIRKPAWAGRVDHEAELGIVIGKVAFDLESPEAARDYIFGATCVNDVTARELQDKDVQFTRAKGFDTFCPLGPCLASDLDLSDLKVEGRVNGALRQRSSTRELIFSPEYLVYFVSRVMTLFPGDIISTGTPAGIGPLAAGDQVEVEVEGVGVLRNPVAMREER
ncbi:MAG TPA: fumarylacetoacetate hydrolase family protein [Vicinamibacteria bacterium]|nr:fumarylacetoacetate hydrolase family protein [Vicinamibacteria bacterium]